MLKNLLTIRVLVCLVIPVVLFGCGPTSNKAISPRLLERSAFEMPVDKSVAVHTGSDKEVEAGEMTPSKESVSFSRKVIKEGQISFRTQDLAATRVRIDKLLKQHEGFVVEENQFRYGDRIEQRLVLRVPADKFDSLLEAITKGIERLDSRHVTVQDVTEKYLDFKSRLRTKKELEDRYRQLLSKATTVKDMLAIEEQMSKLREDIESIEGKLKYLQNRIDYSTLTVTFYERRSSLTGFTSQLSERLISGWNNLIWFALGLVEVWPFILIALILIFAVRAIRRGRRNRKQD